MHSGAIFEYLSATFRDIPAHWLGPDRSSPFNRRSLVRQHISRATTQIGNPLSTLHMKQFHLLAKDAGHKIDVRAAVEGAVVSGNVVWERPVVRGAVEVRAGSGRRARCTSRWRCPE